MDTLSDVIPVETVQERDIDLLVLEELKSNGNFRDWILTKTIGRPTSYTTIGAWHSLRQVGLGESDLALKIKTDTEKVIFLFENKIDADFMPDQAGRYRLRGQHRKNDGDCDNFYTILLAPQKYIAGNKDFDFFIEYEELRGWFINQSNLGDRAKYKAEVLEIAIEKQRRGYNAIVDEGATNFWWSYYKYAEENYPHLKMRKPPVGIPKGSTFIYFLPDDIGLRRGDVLVHKSGGQRGNRIDLQLNGMRDKVDELKKKYGRLIKDNMAIEKAAKSACIRIYVESIDVAGSFEEQFETVKKALAHADELYQWAKKNLTNGREKSSALGACK